MFQVLPATPDGFDSPVIAGAQGPKRVEFGVARTYQEAICVESLGGREHRISHPSLSKFSTYLFSSS
jgi:hypothetical protein